MNDSVITVTPSITIPEAASMMSGSKVGCLIAVDSEMYPIGILTHSNIMKALADNKGNVSDLKVSDLMSSPVISLPADTDLDSATVLMATSRIRQLAVISGKRLCGIISYRDLTEDMRKSYYMLDELIQDKANKDHLTGLYNRGYAMEQLRYQFEMNKRITTPLCIYMLDLDHFKKINDTYGHPCGDRVLKTAAFIIKDSARAVDVVSRYGGEEFMITGFVADEASAKILPERIRKTLESTSFFFEGKPLNITVSIGYSMCNTKCSDAATLLERADKALYEAKNSGRNKSVFLEFKQT